MDWNGNQRRVYLLAIVMLVAAIALVCSWFLWLKPKAVPSGAISPQSPGITAEPSAAPGADVQTVAGTEGESQSSVQETQTAQKVSTIVYYQDNEGYLVPVMCSVPKEDGIAKATLALMVKNTANDMQAARLGLRTVLPENTQIDLDISGGLAKIDLSREVLNLPDAGAELNMVDAVVGALTEFDTVKEVAFLIGGEEMETLTHGTKISGRFTRGDINLEASEDVVNVSDSNPVTLYFPSEVGTVVVPVTRMVYSKPDINTAVLELAKGPSDLGALESVVPPGCGLIDVSVENGVAKLNFTKEFAELALNSDGGRMALKALVLTCVQFDGVEKVEIYVEGEQYDPGKDTLSVPTFANVEEDIVYEAIQTQASMLISP